MGINDYLRMDNNTYLPHLLTAHLTYKYGSKKRKSSHQIMAVMVSHTLVSPICCKFFGAVLRNIKTGKMGRYKCINSHLWSLLLKAYDIKHIMH